jgi:hypothetical protein
MGKSYWGKTNLFTRTFMRSGRIHPDMVCTGTGDKNGSTDTHTAREAALFSGAISLVNIIEVFVAVQLNGKK